jgi:ATP-dependent DNA helicase RecG
MLTSTDIKRLLDAGSGPRIEIAAAQSATAERLARTLTALANARGGVVVVPLGERSKIDPQEARDRAIQALLTSEPRLIVPLPYFVGHPDAQPDALVIEVPEGLPNVYSVDGRYLTRDETRNSVMPARALRELLLTRGEGTWESTSPSGSSKDDLNWTKVEQYAEGLRQGDDSVEALLLRRGCVLQKGRQIKPTYAGLLLFGRAPGRWVRGAEIVCARYKGEALDDAFTRQTIGGTLPDQIRRAELFLIENTGTASRLKGWQREDQTPYPNGVLREAVVNAVAHRDYRVTGNQIQVLMFGNRVEVRSPGKLPGHVTIKNLLRERYSRNEAVVQVLSDMGFIERLGYGIDRMVRAMRDAAAQPPKFEETDAGFTVTLFARTVSAEDVVAALGTSAQADRVEKMLAFVRKNGRITNRDYQDLCPDVSAESLRRDFVEAVERGVLMRVGDKRGTYYILK